MKAKDRTKSSLLKTVNLSLESLLTTSFRGVVRVTHADSTLLSSVTSGIVVTKKVRHLGKRLFNDFSQDDWNQFYTFGFKCIQLFLREGLVNGAMGSYEEKQLATSVASEPEVQEWIRNYVMEQRVQLNHHVNNGVACYALHLIFTNDIDPMIAKYWDKTRLMKALYEYVSKLDGYDWNPHKANRGNTMSDRRFLVQEEDGVQKPYVQIESDSDSVEVTTSPANDDDFDVEGFFAKHIGKD